MYPKNLKTYSRIRLYSHFLLAIFNILLFTGCGNPAGSGNSANDLIITYLDLTAYVTPPVKGEIPDYTDINTDQYTGTVTWKREDLQFMDEVFQPETVYIAEITIQPKSGWTLDGLGINSFVHHGFMTVQFNSPIVSLRLITTALGVDTPVNAFILDSYIIPPSVGAIPNIALIENAQYSGTINWKTVNDDNVESVFMAGTGYKAIITLTAKSGFTFIGVSASPDGFEYNTVTGSLVYHEDGGEGNFEIIIIFPDLPHMDQFILNNLCIWPLAGRTPVIDPQNLEKFTQYTPGTIQWKIHDGDYVSGNFTTNTVYDAIVILTASPGYIFNGSEPFSYTGVTSLNLSGSGTTITITIVFPQTAEINFVNAWYVDENGNDSNDGITSATPLANINKALSLINKAYLDTAVPWPEKDSKPETAYILISGTITNDSFSASGNGMVYVNGGSYPPLEIAGYSASKPGIIDATGKNKRVLYITQAVVTMADYLTLTGGIENNGGGVFISATGSFIMNGGYITGNKGKSYGCGVYMNGKNSTFTMTGGCITGNTSDGTGRVWGGGVAVFGTFLMTGGSITENILSDNGSGSGSGAGIYVTDGGIFIMDDGSISYNETTCSWQAFCNGGGVCIQNNSSFIMNDGTISYNKVLGNGNYANGNGGGVYVRINSSFIMNGGSIVGNTAQNISSISSTLTRGNGGGVFIQDSSFIMNGGSIINNFVKFSAGYIFGNTNCSGGGVYVERTTGSDSAYTSFIKTGPSIIGGYDDTVIANVIENSNGDYVPNHGDAVQAANNNKNTSLLAGQNLSAINNVGTWVFEGNWDD